VLVTLPFHLHGREDEAVPHKVRRVAYSLALKEGFFPLNADTVDGV
ncbi:unnamed protein product, partial [Ixodes pacificus]